MKANELRIGNWVEFEGKHYRIDSISKTFPTLDTTEFGIGVVDWNNLKPIPLTEEWLIKFGFEDVTSEDFGVDKRIKTFEKEFFKIYLPEYRCRLFGITYVDAAFLKIEFVHQLQNLYFALTGEELELKKS